jgi:methyltransferase (TIGR00027 family)
MTSGQPSRTSIMVAAGRAFGAREPDVSVRNPDYLAGRFLGPAKRQLIIDHPIAAALEEDYGQARRRREIAAISNMMLIRTRYIDERMQRAVEGGATQVVILGAGFDTRGYRFETLLKDTKVFEVDYRSTQEFKKRRVAEVVESIPPNVVFVEIDFKRDTLLDVLQGAGYRSGEKTFFIWEGVSMYLPETAVRDTLRTVAISSAPESSLVMDFAGRAIIDLIEKFPDNPMNRFTSGWGEPWTFGVPDGREKEFFRECGLELRETLSLFARETGKRYLIRANGKPLSRGRSNRDPSGKKGFARLTEIMRMMWAVIGAIRRKTKWYALAELTVER